MKPASTKISLITWDEWKPKSSDSPISLSSAHPLSQTTPDSYHHSLFSRWLRAIAQTIQSWSIYWSGSSELKVWKTTDAHGNVRWHTYDPLYNQSLTLFSEDDLRVWLERHYYTSSYSREVW